MEYIKKIEKTDLQALSSLLHASYGDNNDFDINDEIDYFDEMPHDSWFYISEKNVSHGFIRCFEIEDDIFQMELFVKHGPNLTHYSDQLIQFFKKNNSLPESAQLKFELKNNQHYIAELIARNFPASKVKHYRYMEKLLPTPTPNFSCFTYAENEKTFVKIQNILSTLKKYSVDNLKSLKHDGKLMVWFENEQPVAALHLDQINDDTCEIITLATAVDSMRHGYAQKLLRLLFQNTSFSRIILKVEDSNTPAVNLYIKTGFKDIQEKSEQWWYVSLNNIIPEDLSK